MLYWLTTNLWTTGQGLITRQADAEAAAAGEEELSHSAERRLRRRNGATRRKRLPRSRLRRNPDAGAQGGSEEKGSRRMSEGISVEMTGETVGEAKWAAVRELERMHPGLDKAAVRFQVVTEGERGLLGVGYEPARVVASLARKRRRPAGSWNRPAATAKATTPARLREVVERIAQRNRRAVHRRDRGERGRDPRRLRRPRPRDADRPSRPDDRRDPVPRQRDSLPRPVRGAQAGDRRCGRLPRPPPGDPRRARTSAWQSRRPRPGSAWSSSR